MSEKDANPSAKDALVGGSLFGRWEKLRGREGTVVGITAILVAVFPYIFARAPVVSGVLQGYQSLATLILIWGIFAIG
ncbi:branched-chain amino acid ABC transporter permease, partial [Halobellus sp. Atlit-38R]